MLFQVKRGGGLRDLTEEPTGERAPARCKTPSSSLLVRAEGGPLVSGNGDG